MFFFFIFINNHFWTGKPGIIPYIMIDWLFDSIFDSTFCLLVTFWLLRMHRNLFAIYSWCKCNIENKPFYLNEHVGGHWISAYGMRLICKNSISCQRTRNYTNAKKAQWKYRRTKADPLKLMTDYVLWQRERRVVSSECIFVYAT